MKSTRKVIASDELYDTNEDLYFIVGYTEGGFPYGITWEYAKTSGLLKEELSNKKKQDGELPF